MIGLRLSFRPYDYVLPANRFLLSISEQLNADRKMA